MILEVATLDVRPGETENFGRDFRKAQALVAQTPGYQKNELVHRQYEPFPVVAH